MFKKVFTAVVILAGAGTVIYAQELWVGKDGNTRNADTRALVVDGSELYLATRNEVYRARSEGQRWESIFSIPAGENEVTCLGGRARTILVGTRKGLFRSSDGGKTWKNVFRTIIPDKNNVVSLDVSKYDPKTVAVATLKGVFISADLGNSWRDISDNIKNKSLRCVALNKYLIYAGGEDGLYVRKGEGAGWERIYVKSAPAGGGGEEAADTVEPGIEPETIDAVNCIAVKGLALYTATNKNILYSENAGKDWRELDCAGLSGEINYILPGKKDDKLYCATTKGVFEFKKDKVRWVELYRGMEKGLGASSLITSDDGSSLWAVTEKGLYKLEQGVYAENGYADIEKSLKTFKVIFEGEPTYANLVKAALKFNEVSPDKINKWRKESRLRALMPKVSVGNYRHIATNTEIYTSATKDYVSVGPDNITNGIDLSVSWDLGNIVWSDDQTNIDVRSRLTTQLRNDILDDLRRAYYERKRLQFELMQSPPKDVNLRFEKEMRVQELTCAIDDLTGNYLSENTESQKTGLSDVRK